MSSKVQRSRPGGTSPLRPAVESPIVGNGTANPQTPEVTESRSPAVTESRTPEARKPGSSAAGGGEPRYLQLVRKEARLRVDQVDALATLRRQLGRRRTRRSDEILTDNTLIRVAVDLLLARADELHGDTEVELLASLTQAAQS